MTERILRLYGAHKLGLMEYLRQHRRTVIFAGRYARAQRSTARTEFSDSYDHILPRRPKYSTRRRGQPRAGVVNSMTGTAGVANPDDHEGNEEAPPTSRRKLLRQSAVVGAAMVGATAFAQTLPMSVAAAVDERVGLTMTPAQAAIFMRKLATDDSFRRSLETNPREVLATNGISIPSDMLPKKVSLPPKTRIQEVIRAVNSELETPTAGGLAAAFPLAFVLVLVFVFIPASTNSAPVPPAGPTGFAPVPPIGR